MDKGHEIFCAPQTASPVFFKMARLYPLSMTDALSILLYRFQSEEIKVEIEARFELRQLIVEGYDIGTRVKEYWGDSDYEYSITLPEESVTQLYHLFGIWPGDRQQLLRELKKRFHTNTCFSDLRNFLDQHGIRHTGFSWI
jgi:hypothetical protein